MANSQLENILIAITAWEITVNTGVASEVITAIAVTDHNANVASPQLPVRIISPVVNAFGGKIGKTGFGSGVRTAVWKLEDLMLYRPITQVLTPGDAALTLVRYPVAYEHAVDTYRSVYTNALIEEVEMETGVYAYPNGAKNLYYGVLCTLTIKEIIT